MDSSVPPRPTNPWNAFVDKLNLGYNLDLRVPDLRLSPKKRKEAQKTDDDVRAERIHSLIRQLASQCPDILSRIELQFNQEARAIRSNWVRKPRAAVDILPVTDALPRASNVVERRELQECLLHMLKAHHAVRGKGTSVRNRPTGQPLCLKRQSDEKLLEPSGCPTPLNGAPNRRPRAALDRGSFRTTSHSLDGQDERVAMPGNRSFEFRDNLAAAHPPRNHSFSGLPPPVPRAHGPRPSAHPPSPPSFRGAPGTRMHSFGHRIVDPESANTSITTRQSDIFSCPPPYDSDSSQSTVPNDDREEYKDIDMPVDMAFYRPQTPVRPGDIESMAHLNDDATSGFTLPPFTSSEAHAMIALDPTTTEVDGSGFPGERSEDSELPDVPLTSHDQNAKSAYAEATMVIRQHGPNSSAPPIPATESTYLSADLDDRLPTHGGLPIPDKPPICHQPLTLEDRLSSSWRE